MTAAVVAVAHALPEEVVTNAPIARRLGVGSQWIVARTGIHERRVAAADARVGAACTGWVSALSVAAGMIESSRATTAVVTGAEIMTRLADPDDRCTAVSFPPDDP